MSAPKTLDELRAALTINLASMVLLQGGTRDAAVAMVAQLDALLASERAAAVNRTLALLLENGVINELIRDQVREAMT